MAEMVSIEKLFCRSAPWRLAARKVVAPWALQRQHVRGRGLEIGAGSGLMAAEMLRRFPELELTVTDLDKDMLRYGRERLGSFGERALIQQADATHLPFADSSYDYVFSFIMLHHVLDWEGALRESLRVLRPGGWLVGADILESLVFRAIHRLGSHDIRFMRYDELTAALDRLPIDRAYLDRSFGRRLIRFRIRKG